MKILVIGDSCEDIFRYGDITRVAPEAPVPVIVPVREESNPGMAGNVVANLKALGAEVHLITNTEPIRKIRYVDVRYNQMVLRVDENDRCSRFNGNVDVSDYDALIISDYCKGFLREEDIKEWAEAAWEIPTFLDTKKELGEWCNNIDYIKINSLEHEKNKKQLIAHPHLYKKLIITKGKHGCEFQGMMYATTDVPVKDVSGAGDTFIAGLVFEFIRSYNVSKAIDFAQECTTTVVQKAGVATV